MFYATNQFIFLFSLLSSFFPPSLLACSLSLMLWAELALLLGQNFLSLSVEASFPFQPYVWAETFPF